MDVGSGVNGPQPRQEWLSGLVHAGSTCNRSLRAFSDNGGGLELDGG